MNRIHLLVLLLLAVVAVPFAAADTIQLFNNTYGNIGSVTLTQNGGNVNVTLTAASGFSFKVGGGGDILFNSGASLTSGSITNLLIGGNSAAFGFDSSATRAGFTFDYDLTGLKGPKGLEAVTSITFTVSNVTVSQLEVAGAKGAMWGVHFCVGTDSKCSSGITGFATSAPPNTVVPEPGTLSLLGTGLVGIAGVLRRRFLA